MRPGQTAPRWAAAAAGVRAGMLSYVDVVEVLWAKVEPQGRESHWNVDGELLQHNSICASLHRGVVPVFGRGVEQ